jgi:hypothetical protein
VIENLFPADVSLRINGDDMDGALRMVPAAKQVLFKALSRQRISGMQNVRQFQPAPDGSLISVILSGPLKHVYISPPPRRGAPTKVDPREFPIHEIDYFPYEMYSGVVRPTSPETKPKVVIEVIDGENTPVLDQFHPSSVCAGAYNLEFEWQRPAKLAVNSSGLNATGDAESWMPKPGQYSGAMKRVVQALYGIGYIETDTEEFISGELPATEPFLAVTNNYNFTWLQTHGIHKADDGSIWIIEVSKVNGVLAMPLPIFNGTDDNAFLGFLNSAGDTDTMNVVFEFGGLPTGEAFPTGATLTDAIAEGKVLQLLTTADMLDVYEDTTIPPTPPQKEGLYAGCGWAFSESGAACDNISLWLRDSARVIVDDNTYAFNTDGLGGGDPYLRYTISQWWRLTFTLNSTPVEGGPYGTGSAVLELVEEELVYNVTRPTYELVLSASFDVDAQPMCFVPAFATNDVMDRRQFRSRPNVVPTPNDDTDAPAVDNDANPKAAVHVFYDGETIEVVRFVPYPSEFYWGMGYFRGTTLGDLDFASLLVPTTFIWGSVGMAVPAFCREGYLIIRCDMTEYALGGGPSTWPLDASFLVDVSGYYSNVGRVDYEQWTELMIGMLSSDVFPGPVNNVFYTLSHLWQTGTWPFAVAFRVAMNLNAGQTGGHIATDGLNAASVTNQDVPAGPSATRATREEYPQSIDIADLAIPIDVKAEQATFVGSP